MHAKTAGAFCTVSCKTWKIEELTFWPVWINGWILLHKSLFCQRNLLFEHWKKICILSSVPPSHKTQLFGQLIPWSWSLTLVGKQFQQVLDKRFLAFGAAWIFQIRSQLPSTLWTLISNCWSRLICYPLLTEYMSLDSKFQILLSFWTDSKTGVWKMCFVSILLAKFWIAPMFHTLRWGIKRSATVILIRSSDTKSGMSSTLRYHLITNLDSKTEWISMIHAQL